MRKGGISEIKKAVNASINAAPFRDRFGLGGRSSNSGITATIFGAYGFVGKYVAESFGKKGSLCYIPFRGDEMEVRPIRPMFELGQLGFIPFSGRDEQVIRESVKHSDVVINLIGKDYETKHIVPTRRPDGKLSRVNFSFEETHVTIAERIARISREENVKAFIHVSALGANENSESDFLRTKALGEQAVRKEFPESIIVRPATVFGAEDRFLRVIADLATTLPIFPIFNEGKTRMQPVFCGDIALAIERIVNGYKDFKGCTFQLAGKELYTLREAVEYVMDVTYYAPPILNLPYPLVQLAGKAMDNTIEPQLGSDVLTRLSMDILQETNNDNLLDFNDLGIEPSEMESKAFDYLMRYRNVSHFRSVEGYYDNSRHGPNGLQDTQFHKIAGH